MAIRDRIRELRRVPAADLRANPKNWRRHPDAQARALQGVLAEIGIADAVIARETPDGLELLDGHLRTDTLQGEVVPVLIVDLNDEEADKLLLTLDPIAAMATADRDDLRALLETVQTDETGLQQLLEDLARENRLGTVAGPDRDPDDAPPAPKTSRVQPGDVWRLGPHRLGCLDATREESWEKLLRGEKAAILWTDPPYGVEYVGKTKEALRIENDGADDLEALLMHAFTWAHQALEPSSPFYICRPPGPAGTVFGGVLRLLGWRFHQELAWVKDSMVLGHSDYHFRHETILYGWTPGEGRPGRGAHKGTRWRGDNSQQSVLEVPRPKASREHPTMKPVALIEPLLRNSSEVGDIVLDPFAGSGSTLVAASRLHRQARVMELDPRYADVILSRYETLTGEKPIRE